MNPYIVILAVACGATFDTGERIEQRVLARDPLDAAIQAEQAADQTLSEPDRQYTHARRVTALRSKAPAVHALAA